MDDDNRLIQLPPDSLVVSVKLAELLGAQVGDDLRVEILDGKRPVRNVRARRPGGGLYRHVGLHGLCRR